MFATLRLLFVMLLQGLSHHVFHR